MKNNKNHHNWPKTMPLGKPSPIPTQYNPSSLTPIKRNHIISTPFYGIDSWNAYELYWLNKEKIPQTRICQISYNAQSPYIIESKSLKLYLNSFNQSIFESEKKVKESISKDIQESINHPVTVTFIKKENKTKKQKEMIKIEKNIKKTHPFSLLSFTNKPIQETLYTDSFRSLCPVTNQPDFATIIITYSGQKIVKQTLFDYLITFQQASHFHETCIEIIFKTLSEHSEIKSLTIQGSFLRRGGIDITPIRSSEKTYNQIPRSFRQ